MSYTALYRKWRPDNFEDVKGQDHIVKTLKNQIKADRVGHAYLFCGTRGTGKTSIAKIFAKAVNCDCPVDGSPCGICASCKSIASGTSMNVIEIDAASNNGVDNIREIREEVAYSPAEGKYKVYIIDEVHMLSIGAFNALLKTLEEPPPYVIFILATTEVHKIPITILSRCQRYDFKRITINAMVNRLRLMMAEEKVKVEEKALSYIAKTADGSFRDAISLMDQCIAFYFDEELTYTKVLDVLGAVDTNVFGKLLRAVTGQDILCAVHILEDIVMQGRELSQFVVDFTWYLRNLLLLKTSDEIEDLLNVSAENMQQLHEEADMIEAEILMRYIRIFSELSNQIKYASQKRVLTEIALIKLCKPSMETDIESLLDRIRQLEEKIEKGIPTYIQTTGSATVAQTGNMLSRQSIPKPELPKAIPEEVKTIASIWPRIIGEMDGLYKANLKGARLSMVGEDRLLIVVPNITTAMMLNREEHKKKIANAIADRIGKTVEFDIMGLEEEKGFEQSYIDLKSVINMEIEIEEK